MNSDGALEREQNIDEILAGYWKADEVGVPIDRQALLARHPLYAMELAEFFADLDGMEQLASPLRAIRPVAPVARAATPLGQSGEDTVDDPPLKAPNKPLAPAPTSTSKIRCPTCHNPIQLGKESDQVLCPGCGSSFRLCEANATDTSSGMRSMGKFQLLERLGLGSFGAVWKARDTELDRTVALKIPHTGLLIEKEERERFQREARAAAQLRHPNIVSVHEVARLNELPVIVSEYVAGVPLKDLLEARRLTFRQSAALAAQIADALEYSHSMGVVHRDIKPANVMVVRSPKAQNPAGDTASQAKDELEEVGKPMILDFGLALRDANEQTMTVDGHVLGTPAYMSPEQAAGQSHQADRRSDVYSLGVVLYQMLAGELPFRGSRVMMLDQVLNEEPRPLRKINDKIPRDLETICLKCLRKEPAKRYASAGELAADLRRFLAGEPIAARRVSAAEQLIRWVRRRPAAAALILVGAMASLGLTGTAVGWWYTGELEERGKQLKYAQEGAKLMAQMSVAREIHDQVIEKSNTYFYNNHVALAQRACRDKNPERAGELLDNPLFKSRRGWEWHYLDRLCHSGVTNASRDILQDAGSVSSVAFTPDGRWLATGSHDHTVVLHDLTGQEKPRVLGKLVDPVLSVAISGAVVAAGSGDPQTPKKQGQVGVWDLRSGDRLFDPLDVAGAAWSVAISPDSKYLAVGSGDAAIGTVQIWHTDTGKPVTNFNERLEGSGGSRCVAFNRDGKFLGGGLSNANTVKVWAVKTGEELLRMPHGAESPRCLAFSPDGNKLYTGDTANVVKVWDAHNGKLRSKEGLRGHAAEVRSLAFNPDGNRLVSASKDQTLKVWDVKVNEEILTLAGHTGSVNAVAFSRDGLIASASDDGTVKIWDGRPRDKK